MDGDELLNLYRDMKALAVEQVRRADPGRFGGKEDAYVLARLSKPWLEAHVQTLTLIKFLAERAG